MTVAIFLSSSGLRCGKKESQRSCALPLRRRERVKFCFVCVSEHMFTLLYLPSILPSYTHIDKSSSWAPPTTSSTHALYHGFRGLGLTLAPQLSDMGGVVGGGHGSLIP